MGKKQKHQKGQFYTTQWNKLFPFVDPAFIFDRFPTVEPFVGQGDLINYVKSVSPEISVETYDIDPKIDGAILRDTLKHPPDYTGKCVITNPPYLGRNKSKDKSMFDQWGENDLYKCFMRSIIDDCPQFGMIIIPSGFWTSVMGSDVQLRRDFLEKHHIIVVNMFECPMFDDTTTAVCSVVFVHKNKFFQKNKSKFANDFKSEDTFGIRIFSPKGKKDLLSSYRIIEVEASGQAPGGHIYELKGNKYTVERATKRNEDKGLTGLVVRCLDGSADNLISMYYSSCDAEKYVDRTKKLSGRSFMTLIIKPEINKVRQKRLAKQFNKFLDNAREKYSRMFLPNYREAKGFIRKRIPFELVYNLSSYLLSR
jgi:hypothetical protein